MNRKEIKTIVAKAVADYLEYMAISGLAMNYDLLVHKSEFLTRQQSKENHKAKEIILELANEIRARHGKKPWPKPADDD